MEKLPIDPFDGKPLKLLRSDDSFEVYSVGIDGIDNGGLLDKPGNLPGSDIGFRLFDPAKRRQPARPMNKSEDEEKIAPPN